MHQGGTMSTTTRVVALSLAVALAMSAGVAAANTSNADGETTLQTKPRPKRKALSKRALLAKIKRLRARQAHIAKAALKLRIMSNEAMPKQLPAKDRKTWPKFTSFLGRSAKLTQGRVTAWKGKLDGMNKKIAAIPAGDTRALMAATKDMQEMNMSFNLQYLQLQNKISHENRQFTMVSNIMKNKHDTAKNSINNIR
jgi:hypothetical protein